MEDCDIEFIFGSLYDGFVFVFGGEIFGWCFWIGFQGVYMDQVMDVGSFVGGDDFFWQFDVGVGEILVIRKIYIVIVQDVDQVDYCIMVMY